MQLKDMHLTKNEQEYVRKCVEEAGWAAAQRFEWLDEKASDAALMMGEAAVLDAESEGLGPDEATAAYSDAAREAQREVWIRDAYGDDPPANLVFTQPSESEYIEAAKERAEEEALRNLRLEVAKTNHVDG